MRGRNCCCQLPGCRPPSRRVPPPPTPIKRSAGRSSGGCCLAPFKSAPAGAPCGGGTVIQSNGLPPMQRSLSRKRASGLVCAQMHAAAACRSRAVHYLAIGGASVEAITRQQLFRICACPHRFIGLFVY